MRDQERRNGIDSRLSACAKELEEIELVEQMLDSYERELERGLSRTLAELSAPPEQSGSDTAPYHGKIKEQLLARRDESLREIGVLRSSLRERRDSLCREQEALLREKRSGEG